MLRAGLLLVLVITLMLFQSVPLTLAVLAVLPVLAAASIWYRPRAFRVQMRIRETMATMLTHVNESLVGMRVVQAFAIEPEQHEVFRDVSLDTYDAKRRAGGVTAVYSAAIEFLVPVALAVLIGVGSHLVANHTVKIGVVIAFSLYINRLFEPILQFTELTNLLQAAGSVVGARVRVPRHRSERRRPSRRLRLRTGWWRGALRRCVVPLCAGRSRCGERCRSRHPGPRARGRRRHERRRQEHVCQAGPRFYDASEGQVVIDGQNLRDVTGSSLRRHVIVVPQEGFLFDGTVADNVGVARGDAGRDEIEAACAAMGLGERIAAIPGGLDAVVANRGLTLSSGQRQLVALARAFLAEPDVIVLDEATSNLDPATDALVERAMQMLLADRTAIVIAHRINTAIRADRVLVFEHGRVVEDGPPSELELIPGGAFARWVAATVRPRSRHDLFVTVWTPDPVRAAGSRMHSMHERFGTRDFAALHELSVREPDRFWRAVWDDCGVVGDPGEVVFDPGDGSIRGARFFTEARLNFAENLLLSPDDSLAIIATDETGRRRELTRRDLHDLVARTAAAMRAEGVQPGDRVAAWMANVPETVAIMLAAASVGAVFSSTSPDFGVAGVVDRFGQIEPVLLFAVDGYQYGGKRFDCTARLGEIATALPTVRRVIVVRHVHEGALPAGAVAFDEWLPATAPASCAQLPFDHPLAILYSSGTTGPPKCIVHRAGGILLKHLTEHQLHCDMRAGDRVFYFTTCGWMMWNWLVRRPRVASDDRALRRLALPS